MNKLLTINDLIAFCNEQNFSNFNAEESGYQICVQIPSTFNESEEKDSDTLYAYCLAFHTSDNLNHSNVTEDAAKKAMQSMAYKPVLANFCEIDGVRDFTSHDFEIDEDGNFTYFEKQVGCFTADKPYMEDDPEVEGRKNVFAKVAIPRNYTDAAEIIERKNGTNVSVELAINSLEWDGSTKTLLLTDITVMGLTLLGKDPNSGQDVKPGMANAHIQLEDFSAENNSVVFNKAELIDEITQAVMNKLDDHINNNQRKEDPKVRFEENKEETTVEEMEVESTEEAVVTEEMSEEATEETPEVVVNSEEDELKEPIETESVEERNESADDVAFADDDPVETDPGSEADDDDGEDEEDELDLNDDGNLNNGQQDRKAFTINGMTFEVSMSEIMYSLYELVNNSYGEVDNDYYSVDVYEGSKTVVMTGMFSGRSYRQSYKVRNNVYSLVGDRVPVKAVYVTETEEAELDKMRANYSSISEKLAKYESEPEKIAALESADYAAIANEEDFINLKKRENYFDLSVNEVKEKADQILLQYAKSGKMNFAAEEKKEESKKDFFAFARVESKNNFLDTLLKSSK